MTITQFEIISIHCKHALFQMLGNALKFAFFPCSPDVKLPPVLQALLCYMCGQQLQHREARGKTKGQPYTNNKKRSDWISLRILTKYYLTKRISKQWQQDACFNYDRPQSGLADLANTNKCRIEDKTNSSTSTWANVHISCPSPQSIKPPIKYERLYFFVICIPYLL